MPPWPSDYGEGCVRAMVQLLAERGSYSPDMRAYPLVHGNSPPVFIALNWPLYAFFGPSLFFPRLLSLLSTALLLGALFFLLVRLLDDRLTAAFLSLSFLTPWFVQTWAALGRVDMLACLLSLLGLLFGERDREEAGWRRYRAFPLFWLAFFTKQNALLAPAAVLLHAWLEDRRELRRALPAFLLPLLALLGLLVAVTGGLAFRHLVTYTAAAEYEWPRMVESYGEFALITWPAQALIVAGLVLAGRPGLARPGRAFGFYGLPDFLALATNAQAGPAQNYFIEPWLATLLTAGLVLRVLRARFPAFLAWSPACVLALVLAA